MELCPGFIPGPMLGPGKWPGHKLHRFTASRSNPAVFW